MALPAVYGEMRTVLRRVTNCSDFRTRLQDTVIPNTISKGNMELMESMRSRPYHVAWHKCDVKCSSFKTLEKMGRCFHSEQLCEIVQERWRNRVHHSPNFRTCK